MDPRVLAVFNVPSRSWRRFAGRYQVWLGDSAADLKHSIEVRLPAWQHSARWPVRAVRPAHGGQIPAYYRVTPVG